MARPVFLWDVLQKLLLGSLALVIAITFWVLSVFFLVFNLLIAWHRIWRWLGIWNLVAIRFLMRWRNLYDTSTLPGPNPAGDPRALRWDPRYQYQRTADGSFNDLDQPRMGSAGTRFARNFPLNQLQVDEKNLVNPNPRQVSLQLMTRDRFRPATSLNLLAAAWIQFQVHDWFNHKRRQPANPAEHLPGDYLPKIPLAKDDKWPGGKEDPDDRMKTVMWIRRTEPDASREQSKDPPDAPGPPTFVNTEAHWWDGSQIYGSSEDRQRALRLLDGSGKLKMEGRRLPLDPDLEGIELTGFNDNWWVGLSLFHTLFALEHNAICDRLRKAYPDWNDERLFQTARLINVALIAKIHTIEWTPAILGHPTLLIGMRANWWGILTERIGRSLGRFRILGGLQEEISGIPASERDHHTAPFYLTEEFVSVYRMHPLIPDDYRFYSSQSDEVLAACELGEIQGKKTREFMKDRSLEDLFYSFGLAHPGAITLNNFPRALQRFERIKEGTIRNELLDVAAVDVMRDRERCVPRYNQFRRFLLMLPAVSYRRLVGVPCLPWLSGLTKREIADRKRWARELEELYPDQELLDLMVGLLAEKRPKGFGFSDTAFRIFILMASRRLKSDRFFTADYKPEVYTQAGLDWINENGLKSVLQRHLPALSGSITDVENPFVPWKRVEQPSTDPTADNPESVAYKPLFAGVAAGWIVGAVVHLYDAGLTLDNLIDAFASPDAGRGAAIGAVIGAACMGIVNLLSLMLTGRLTSRERAETWGGFGSLAGWLAGTIGRLYVSGQKPVGLLHAFASPEALWGALSGLIVGAVYSGALHLKELRAERKISLTTIITTPLRRAAERALFVGLSGAIIGLVIGLLVSLGCLLLGGGATAEPIALGILIGAGIGFLVAAAGSVVMGLAFAAALGLAVGAGLYLLRHGLAGKVAAALGSPLARWGALAGLIAGAIWGAGAGRCLSRNAAWALIGACRGAVTGFAAGALITLAAPLFMGGAAVRTVMAALQSVNAWTGAAVGTTVGAVAWLYWPSELKWTFRRYFWNLFGWLKFFFNRPLKISRPPEPPGNLKTEPLSGAIPGIPIDNIQVVPESRIPGDERSRLKSFIYKVQLWLYEAFPPMQPGLKPIAADPQWALRHAYRWLRLKTFDPPDLPPEYEGSPDLGSLAVRGPYACYTRKLDDKAYQWDLSVCANYACHAGLYGLGGRVLFKLNPASGRLEPFEIESALGVSRPTDTNWQLAKKLALCSATTHLSLVRHFNWVHLASGAHLAVATRNRLPEDHPLCRLLWPHVYGTQQSNDMVTRGQMVRGGDFETMFSFRYEDMCRLFADSYRGFPIVVNDPEQDGADREIRKKGFATPTQDNLEDLFGAIHGHVRNYLQIYFTDTPSGASGGAGKKAVGANEPILQWLDELNGLIPNGVEVTRQTVAFDSLCRLVARFIYLVTVQHELVGSFLWNYQLWTHRQPVRVYKNGQREPLDVYQRLVNANYNLNVDRTPLMSDFSGLAIDKAGNAAFREFQAALAALQKKYEDEPWAVWRMYPKMLKANINA